VFAIVLLLIPSCGGPYKSKRVNLPDQKLAIAAELFEAGKYSDAAVEYKDFLATFAGDERSDYAQFRLAECYRMDEEYAFAAVEYRILISDYGYSEYIDDAFFLEGLCAFEQAPRAERDQMKSYEALGRINRFLQLFSNSPRRKEAEEILSKIHHRLGEKDFLNAKLYFSDRHYRAASIYFDKVITNYPETVWCGKSHYYKGVILESTGEIEKAIKEYEMTLSCNGNFGEKADAQRKLGELSQGKGK
jgi:outer membrane protein assembly factor BamD